LIISPADHYPGESSFHDEIHQAGPAEDEDMSLDLGVMASLGV
jgi:hypothetical protein